MSMFRRMIKLDMGMRRHGISYHRGWRSGLMLGLVWGAMLCAGVLTIAWLWLAGAGG